MGPSTSGYCLEKVSVSVRAAPSSTTNSSVEHLFISLGPPDKLLQATSCIRFKHLFLSCYIIAKDSKAHFITDDQRNSGQLLSFETWATWGMIGRQIQSNCTLKYVRQVIALYHGYRVAGTKKQETRKFRLSCIKTNFHKYFRWSGKSKK